jgi:hypothetical protein
MDLSLLGFIDQRAEAAIKAGRYDESLDITPEHLLYPLTFIFAKSLDGAVKGFDSHGFETVCLFQDSVPDLIKENTDFPRDANTDRKRRAPHDKHASRRMRLIMLFRGYLNNQVASLLVDGAPAVQGAIYSTS